MDPNIHQILSRLVADCTEKVFSAYGTELQRDASNQTGHEVVAVIGYAADEVRGGLALGLTEGLAQRTMPTPDMPVYDWAGELANQILGRVRNKLLAYKLDIQISTPVVLHGLGVEVAPLGDLGVTVASYRSEGELVQALLEARFEDGYALPEKQDAEGVVDEGMMLLF